MPPIRAISIESKLIGIYTPVKTDVILTAKSAHNPQSIDINDRLNGRLFFPI